MLGLVARYADAWNTVWHNDVSATLPGLRALDDACAAVGRDPATIVRTAGGNVAQPGYTGKRADPIEGSNDQIAERIAAFRDAGFAHFVAGLDPCTPQSIEQFARIIEILDRTSVRA